MDLRSKEFPTQEALSQYLKDHPGADKSLHSVKKDAPSTEDELRKHVSPEKRREFLRQHKPDSEVLKQEDKKKDEKSKGEGSIQDALRDKFSPEQLKEYVKKHKTAMRVVARFLTRT